MLLCSKLLRTGGAAAHATLAWSSATVAFEREAQQRMQLGCHEVL